MNSYPRETNEFAPVPIRRDGQLVTTGVQYAITTDPDARPTDWQAAEILDGKTGITITGYAPGFYYVYAKVTSNPEVPVLDCGAFRIT